MDATRPARCARSWRSNVTCAPGTITRRACRPAPRARPFACNQQPSSALPKISCASAHNSLLQGRIRKMTTTARSTQQGQRRVWRVPASKAWWLWLAFCTLLYGVIFAIYLYALKTQPFPGPFNEPLRSFGIVAFLLVLAAASYSLRRRFARNLPGKAQNWLWMHTWLGVTAILVALLHENFTHILRDYCANANCLTNAYGGT